MWARVMIGGADQFGASLFRLLFFSFPPPSRQSLSCGRCLRVSIRWDLVLVLVETSGGGTSRGTSCIPILSLLLLLLSALLPSSLFNNAIHAMQRPRPIIIVDLDCDVERE